jgi:hypothetical protein
MGLLAGMGVRPQRGPGWQWCSRLAAGSTVTCGNGWWACQDLNLGPHPYQLNAGNRCADRRSRRSRPTVDAKGMRSIGALVCVLFIASQRANKHLEVDHGRMKADWVP